MNRVKGPDGKTVKQEGSHKLQTITLCNERFSVPEVLFAPSGNVPGCSMLFSYGGLGDLRQCRLGRIQVLQHQLAIACHQRFFRDQHIASHALQAPR